MLNVGSSSPNPATVEASTLPLRTEAAELSARSRSLGNGAELGGNRVFNKTVSVPARLSAYPPPARKSGSAAQAQGLGDLFSTNSKSPSLSARTGPRWCRSFNRRSSRKKSRSGMNRAGLPRPQRAHMAPAIRAALRWMVVVSA